MTLFVIKWIWILWKNNMSFPLCVYIFYEKYNIIKGIRISYKLLRLSTLYIWMPFMHLKYIEGLLISDSMYIYPVLFLPILFWKYLFIYLYNLIFFQISVKHGSFESTLKGIINIFNRF